MPQSSRHGGGSAGECVLILNGVGSDVYRIDVKPKTRKVNTELLNSTGCAHCQAFCAAVQRISKYMRKRIQTMNTPLEKAGHGGDGFEMNQNSVVVTANEKL